MSVRGIYAVENDGIYPCETAAATSGRVDEINQKMCVCVIVMISTLADCQCCQCVDVWKMCAGIFVVYYILPFISDVVIACPPNLNNDDNCFISISLKYI